MEHQYFFYYSPCDKHRLSGKGYLTYKNNKGPTAKEAKDKCTVDHDEYDFATSCMAILHFNELFTVEGRKWPDDVKNIPFLTKAWMPKSFLPRPKSKRNIRYRYS